MDAMSSHSNGSTGDSSNQHTSTVQETLKKLSSVNIDDYVKVSTFSDEALHDVSFIRSSVTVLDLTMRHTGNP